MKRFFFDYTAKNQAVYDYRGDEFGSIESAIEFAHETANILQHDPTGVWFGWSIEVRNAEGKRFFSLPLEVAGLVAA
jgi:hypothetical protein